jgi:hypothetical protein
MGVIAPQALGQLDHAAIAIFEYIVVPEADHAIAFAFKNCSSFGIGLLAVLPAVYLEDQAVPMTGEIGVEMAKADLSPKPGFGETLLQKFPHPAFRIGLIQPQMARAFQRTVGWMLLHRGCV